MVGGMFEMFLSNVWKNGFAAPAKQAYVNSFVAQMPAPIASKLTEEEKRELAELSWNIFTGALDMGKSMVVGALKK